MENHYKSKRSLRISLTPLVKRKARAKHHPGRHGKDHPGRHGKYHPVDMENTIKCRHGKDHPGRHGKYHPGRHGKDQRVKIKEQGLKTNVPSNFLESVCA